MAAPLGPLFLSHARRPLSLSSERFHANLLGDGVRAVEGKKLVAALEEGKSEVARMAGVAADAVERAMPRAEIADLTARLSASQTAALAAIRRNELTMTSFAVPSAARASPATHMIDVAEHFARDKPIAASLRALAADVAAWEELIGRCGASIDADADLTRRHQRRQAVRATLRRGGGAAAFLAACVIAFVGYRVHAQQKLREAQEAERRFAQMAARARVEDALRASDPCVGAALPAEDREEATSDQRGRLAALGTRCERERDKKAREERCRVLATAVEEGKPIEGGAEAGGLSAELLARLATRALVAEDLLIDEQAMPCGGTQASARMWAAFVAAAGPPGDLWGRAEGVSAAVGKRMATAASFSPSATQSLSFRAEIIANKAIRAGGDRLVANATELCVLKVARGGKPAMACKVLIAKAGR